MTSAFSYSEIVEAVEHVLRSAQVQASPLTSLVNPLVSLSNATLVLTPQPALAPSLHRPYILPNPPLATVASLPPSQSVLPPMRAPGVAVPPYCPVSTLPPPLSPPTMMKQEPIFSAQVHQIRQIELMTHPDPQLQPQPRNDFFGEGEGDRCGPDTIY